MYAVITTIQSFRHRYVVKMEEGDIDPNPYKDYVTVGEVPEELSQYHLGETVTDAYIASKEGVIEQFNSDHIDSESEIFLNWSDDLKLQNVYYPTLKDDLSYYVNFLDAAIKSVNVDTLIKDFKKVNEGYDDLSDILLYRYFTSLQ